MKTKDPCPRTKNYGKSNCPGSVNDTPAQIQNGICKKCKGSGKIKGKKCKACNGTGLLLDTIY